MSWKILKIISAVIQMKDNQKHIIQLGIISNCIQTYFLGVTHRKVGFDTA